MEGDLQLKLDASLESLSLIAAAIHLWETPDAQEEIHNFFHSDFKLDRFTSRHVYRTWTDLKFTIFEKIKSVVPNNISTQLFDVVVIIQEKIYFWYKYVMVDLGLDPKFARKIYWTSIGGIHESRIFQEFWVNEPNFCSLRHNIFGFQTNLFSVACLFVEEDFIQKNSLEIMKGMPEPLEKGLSVYEIIDKFFRLNRTLSYEWNSHILPTFDAALNKASKLLYQRAFNSNEDDEESFLFSVAKTFLEKIENNYFNRYAKDKLIDLFLYFFKKMSLEQKIDFLTCNILSFLAAFLRVWPYQTLFLSFIDKINISYLDNYLPLILTKLFKIKICRDYSDYPDIYKKIEDCFIMKICKMMPREMKRETLLSINNSCFLTDLSDSRLDCRVLKFILNDHDLTDLREQLIEKTSSFEWYVQKFRFFEVDDCMTRLGLTDFEKKKLKMKYNSLSDIGFMSDCVTNELFEKLDKLLNWISDSDIERVRLKKGINAYNLVLNMICFHADTKFCRRYILPKLDSFLNWLYENNKEDVINFKLQLNLTEFYRPVLDNVSESFDASVIYDLLNWQFSKIEKKKVEEIKLKSEANYETVLLLWHLNNSLNSGRNSKSQTRSSLKFEQTRLKFKLPQGCERNTYTKSSS